jgi:uncharacterized membrane protein YhdT
MHSTSEAADEVALVAVEADEAIWSPVAAAGWSLVFTPAFGAYLLMRNWQTLGEPRQAALARVWFCFSLGLLGVQLLSAAINRRLNSESNLMDWLGLVYLAAWCMAAVLPQARLVRSRYGAAGYPRKAWDLVLLYGVLAGVGYFLVRAGLSYLLLAAT